LSAKEIVVSATERLFNQKDLAVVDEVFGPVYVQHSALGADGVEGLKGLVSRLPETSGYELVRVIADGELVVTEGVFTGFAPVPLTGYDVWRVVDGRVVEHWDALGAGATHAASGAGVSTGTGDSAANKALVTEWAEKVLVGGDHAAASASVASESGIDVDGLTVSYVAIHAVIAEGDLVYTRAEGELDGPVIVNDVWRVEGAKIVEHWGLVAPVPREFPHGNGAF
jgi:predicted SnoaL-like aldol condensation-catalyzing enzyme